jgi:hypothetical protein
MNRVLDEFAIQIDVCVRPSRVVDRLSENSVDLVVVDWEDQHIASEIVRKITDSKGQKPTIMAIVDASIPVSEVKQAGAHLVMQKPITPESATASMKRAYSRMVHDYRRYARHAIMHAVSATRGCDGLCLPVTVTNISEGGVGLLTKEKLGVGDQLEFPLTLPGAEEVIHIRARVLWTREPGMAGAEFTNIAHADLRILYAWLWSKCKIKKPITH